MRHLFIPPVHPACLPLPLETLEVSQVKHTQVVSGQSAHDVCGPIHEGNLNSAKSSFHSFICN